MLPLVAAAALFGFVKGVALRGPFRGPNLEADVIGPLQEELLFRAAPLWAFPELPYGTTALVFAVEHVFNDRHAMDAPFPSATHLLARLGDVLLGGLLYESAMRKSGFLAAAAAHSLHNMAVGVGAKVKGEAA